MKAHSLPIDWTLDSAAHAELAHAVLNGLGMGVGPQLARGGNGVASRNVASLREPSSHRPPQSQSKRVGKFGKQVNREDDAALCKCLLANLDSMSRQSVTTTLGIHLNSAWYAGMKNSLPSFASRRRVERVYRLLLAQQLIERTAKGSEHGGSTRIIATPKLLHQFQSLGSVSIRQASDASKVIELRGPATKIKRLATKGKRIGEMITVRFPGPALVFDETEETADLRAGMQRINDHLLSARIGWAKTPEARKAWQALSSSQQGKRRSPPDLTRVRLKRVFNVDWQSGGRMYGGWWQSIPGKDRQHITINDQPTVELDWESLHLRLCYALEGRPAPFMEAPGQWYALPGIASKWRRIIKALTNQMLNCESDDKAIKATMDERKKSEKPKRPGELSDLEHWRTFKTECGSKKGVIKKRLEEWAALIRKHHHGVSRWFDEPKAGGSLQFVESLLMQAVLRQANKAGITALPIHDSVIVVVGHTKATRKIMDESFNVGAGGGIFGQMGDGIKASVPLPP